MTTDQGADTGAERFVVRPTADSHFSWVRTRLSVERTLMSWMRTAIALIGFGFTIVEIVNRLAATAGVAPALHPRMPRYVGLAMIGTGVLALLISCWQYVLVNNYLWGPQFRPIAGLREGGGQTPGLAVAIALAVVGILAFVTVLLRVP
jgi:putative membrane protein